MAFGERTFERLRAREPDAWEETLAALRPRIWGIVCRYAKKPEERLDLFADAQACLTASILAAEGAAGRVRSAEALERWAVRLTKWRCADWKRREAARPDKNCLPGEAASALVDERETPRQDGLSDSEAAVVVAWLLELENRFQQEAIWLHHVEGESCAGIARRLGRSAGAVRQAVFKGLRAIRRRHGSRGRRML